MSFAPIVPRVLYSLAREFHTACASHSGDSSVNGLIVPVINPRADISAVAFIVIEDSPLPNAIAQSVPVADKSILQDPIAYKAPTASPVPVIVIVHSPVADTTSDKSAKPVNVISICPSPFTHITAFPVDDS